jgi:peptidoglycan/LPS O-acetylase OafA/YrhL
MYEHSNRYSESLHVLRGLAAVSVVFFHAAGIAPLSDPGFFSIVHEFGAGVTLFFLLSGFSLVLSNAEKTESPGWIRGYALKRFFRIAPLWYFMIAVSVIFHFFQYGKVYTVGELARHILPLFPFAPSLHESLVWAGWTIGVEIIFYCAFALLAPTLRLNLVGWAILTVFAGLVSASFDRALPEGVTPSFGYMAFPRQFVVFCVGCLLSVLWLRTPSQWIPRLRIVAGGVAVVLFWRWAMAHNAPNQISVWGDPVIFKTCALGALIVATYSRVSAFFNPLTKLWGDASYGVYLMHPIVVFLLKPVYLKFVEWKWAPEASFLAYVAIVLTVVTVLAGLVHHHFEKPWYAYGQARAADRRVPLIALFPAFRVFAKPNRPSNLPIA